MNYTKSIPHKDNIIIQAIDYPNNRLLIDLCGSFDANLGYLETILGIEISRRGNQLFLSGNQENVIMGRSILGALYKRLEQGKTLLRSDIDMVLCFHNGNYTNEVMQKGQHMEIKTRKKTIEPRNPAQQYYLQHLKSNEVVFGLGPAGTGKTYLAVAMAVSMFLDGQVDRIVLSRPAVEAGERLGFLPGDMKEKVDPYMQPLYDALNDFLPMNYLLRLIEEKKIEIAPLAFMRGRTLSDAFVILDEAQNTTTMQMKMFLTRLGNGSRMVVTGDDSQIDLPKGVYSGLREAQKLLQDIHGVGFFKFTDKDVVRHDLVSKIIQAYDRAD